MSLVTTTRSRYAGPPDVPGYAVDEFLGRGSCGVVWSATRTSSGERVALKVFAVDGSAGFGGLGRPEVLAATERELALSGRVDIAHVVRARDRVELEDGRVALALDLADGGTLRDVVTIRGAIPLGEVVTALTPLASALAELAEAGVVHGDLAPDNVLFTGDGRPVLADLASARLVDDGWPQTVVGTSGFTAPEVLAGHPPSPASDIWSLGALAWYARTGGMPPPHWVGDLHWPTLPSGDPGCGLGGSGAAEPGSASLGRTVPTGGTVEEVTAAVGPELRPILVRMLADEPRVRPTGAEAALAIYRAASPEPVVLVGRHPDPAAAVTNRIRREAAETRSRSELRAAEKAHRRGAARARRRGRVAMAMRPRELRSVAGRLAVLGLVVLVLAGGMLALALLNGVPRAVTVQTVSDPGGDTAERGATSTPDSAASVGAPSGARTPAEDPPSATASAEASPPAGLSPTADPPPTVDPRGADAVRADPRATLQGLADARAAGLQAADPVTLGGAEPVGSAAYVTDAATIARLRDQGQRYRDLAFTVRSAEVLSAEPGVVVVRATVDRGECTVAGDDGSTQSLTATPGTPLRYTLRATDAGWRLTDVRGD